MAAEVADDEVELVDEIAEGAGGGEDGVGGLVELVEGFLVVGLDGVGVEGGAEEADEGGV